MTFRRKFTRFLSDYRWYLLGGAAVVAFVLGCIGFADDEVLPDAGPSDIAFWSFKNFLGNSPGPPIPLTLDIARFLAPMVAGWAGLAALGSLFRDRVQQMRIPLMRRHVVICGLGYVGGALLLQLREAGTRVVVIESDTTNPDVAMCRSRGVPVVVGDAQLERTLQAAGVDRAARLIAVTPLDAVNTEIVAQARRLADGRAGAELHCLALIGNPELCALLRIEEFKRGDAPSALDFFNIDEISARLLLDKYRIDTRISQPHILVAHLDPLGAWVVWHAARDWYDRRADETPLLVSVVDDDAESRVQSLRSEYPALEKVCTFMSCPVSVGGIHKLQLDHAERADPPLTWAYVTAYRDERAVETALKLRHHLHADVPLVVALSRAYGVTRLLEKVDSAGGLNIEVFRTLDTTCTVEFIKGGSFETIAHLIHERWRAEQPEGEPAPTWHELDESRKESSRAQARDITVKLRSVGCDIAPLRDWDAREFTFTPEEIERLAIAEHDRWRKERLADGWSWGEKDVAHKKSPYLVPWEDLPPDIAERNRVFVRKIPAMLASVGIQVIRTSELSHRRNALTATG